MKKLNQAAGQQLFKIERGCWIREKEAETGQRGRENPFGRGLIQNNDVFIAHSAHASSAQLFQSRHAWRQGKQSRMILLSPCENAAPSPCLIRKQVLGDVQFVRGLDDEIYHWREFLPGLGDKSIFVQSLSLGILTTRSWFSVRAKYALGLLPCLCHKATVKDVINRDHTISKRNAVKCGARSPQHRLNQRATAYSQPIADRFPDDWTHPCQTSSTDPCWLLRHST